LLEALLARHAIEWALLSTDDGRIPIFDALPGWRRAYADADQAIYVRSR